MEENGKLALLATVAGALLLLFLRLGSYPLLDPDEARFARTSVEMMRSGDYVVPTFEGEPRLVKPPMLHWIQTALFQVGEPSEMLARLPAAASTFVSLLLVAWIGWRRFGVEGSAWSAVFFLTSPLVVVIARVGTLDALLTVHVLAVLALELVQHDDTGLERYGVMGLLLGLALLVKGPVGVLLPLLMILAGRTATGRDVLPSIKTVLTTVLAMAAVALPWGLVFIERIGATRMFTLLHVETVERAVSGTDHIAPWWYYLAVCAVAFLPWAGPLFLGTMRGLAHWRDRDTPTGPFAAAAFAAGLVFFSISKGKLPTYILPLAPLASLVVTFELGQELVNPTKRRAGSALVAMTLVALSVGLGVTAAMSPDAQVQAAATIGAAAFGLAALVALVGVLMSAPRIVYGSGAVGTFGFLLAVVIMSPSFLETHRSAAVLVDKVPALRSTRPLVLVGGNKPSLTYYADRVPEKVPGGQLAERLDRGDAPLIVLLDDSDPNAMPVRVRQRLRELARSGKMRVFEPIAAAP